MTIDGINISTFGLMLSYISGHLDQPARKKTLDTPGFQQKDIVFDSRETLITLIGFYPSKADLGTKIAAFLTLIKSDTIHEFIHSGHNLTISGSVMDGIRIEPLRNTVKITFKLTIIE